MGKSKRRRDYVSISDIFTKIKARGSPIQEPEKILADHSPHKNKVLRQIYFGRRLKDGGKEKKASENECETNCDSEHRTLFSEIQNSKFPIVLVKPVSNEDHGDGDVDLKTTAYEDVDLKTTAYDGVKNKEEININSEKLENDLDKCSSIDYSKSDSFFPTNQPSEIIDSIPGPLNGKVCGSDRKGHRKRGRKKKLELRVPVSGNVKRLKTFKVAEKYKDKMNVDKEKGISISSSSLEGVEKYIPKTCGDDDQLTSHIDEIKQKHSECGFDSDEKEVDDNIETRTLKDDDSKHMQNDENPNGQSQITEVVKTNYKCNFCKYESKIRAHAREHSLTHANFRLYKCSVCDFMTNRKDKILQHLSKIHKLESSYASECSYVTTQDVDVAKEISFCQTVTEESIKAFKCSVCGYLTEDKADGERHLAIHSEIDFGLVNAAECDQESSLTRRRRKKVSNGLFDKFYKTIKKFKVKTAVGSSAMKTTSIFKCSICNYQTIKIDRAKRHSLTHSSSKLFKCLECDFDTNRSEKMHSHMYKVHGIETVGSRRRSRSNNYLHNTVPTVYSHSELEFGQSTKLYKCCFCDYQTDLNYEAAKHFAAHFKSELGLVDSSEFGRVADLNNTFQAQKNRRATKYSEVIERCYNTIDEIEIKDSCSESVAEQKFLYKCTVCDYETDIKARAKRHSLNHLDTKLFQCNLCDYACNRKDKMKIHADRHGTEGKEIRRGRRKDSKESSNENEISIPDFPVIDESFIYNDIQYDSDCNLLSDSIFDIDILNQDNSFQSDYFESFEETIPDFTTPDFTTPNFTTPNFTTPNFTTPDFTTPNFTTSNFTTPNSYLELNGFDADRKEEFESTESYLENETKDVSASSPVDNKPAYSFAELLKCAELDYQSYRENETVATSEMEVISLDKRYLYQSDDNLFHCLECSFQTPKFGKVKNHLKMHDNTSLLECSQCDFHTTLADVFESHRKICVSNFSPSDSKPPKRKILKCPECTCTFKYKKVWHKHLQTHVKSELKTAEIKKSEFKKPVDVYDFSENELENEKEEKSKAELKIQSNSTHKIFKCSNCNYVTKYKFAILKHNPACIKNAKKVKELQKLFSQPTYPSNDVSSYTEYNENNNNNLQGDSEAIASSVRVLNCAECSFQTYSRNRLKKHLQIHKNELANIIQSDLVESPDCNCDTCSNNLTDQLGVHSNAKELFKCSQCSYVTHIQNYLKIHFRVHTNSNLPHCTQGDNTTI